MATKRVGKTVKVSVSLDKSDLLLLQKLALKLHGGNLSAAFAEAARLLRQREARRQLIDLIGGPSLTPEAARAIDLEQSGPPRPQFRKHSRRVA